VGIGVWAPVRICVAAQARLDSVRTHIYPQDTMEKPLSYDECNCFALRQAARYVTQLYERHLAPVGLTAAQFTLLAKLSRRVGWTMAELAESMVMDRTTLVRAMKPLQRDALIVTGAAEHDSRTHVFNLSEAGRERYAAARVHWRQAQAEFEKSFGASRAKALRSELFAVPAG
jgi:DNA-binding MarR family transcriptional regulator